MSRNTPGEPAFAELEDVAERLLRTATQVEAAGPDGRMAPEWQATFAAARAVAGAPAAEVAALAAFGVRVFAGRGALIAAQTSAQRSCARTLAAAVVSLQAAARYGVAAALASLVAAMGGDETLTLLQPFCVCLEALVRCRLAGDSAGDGEQSPAAFWRLALEAAGAQAGAALVICGGLSGSGKSFVANGIGAAIGARVIASDAVRKRLVGVAPTGRTPDERRAEVYSAELTERVYAALVHEAEGELHGGWPVVLDATFLTRSRRAPALALARRLGAPAALAWCELDDPLAAARMRARAGRPWNVSDGDLNVRVQQLRGLERPDGSDLGVSVIRVDAGAAPGAVFDALLPALRQALDGAMPVG